jgi:hypothetical protein
MIEWQVIKFFAGTFFKGFMIGIAIRILIAIFLRSDVSWKGLFNSGLFLGIIYAIMMYIRWISV